MISQCVSTTSFRVQVNDNLTDTFHPKAGLRQGDPLSPYLFIICMNVLSRMLIKAQDQGHLKGIKISRNAPAINHLIYADDILLFFKANLDSCQKFKDIFLLFGNASGLVVNPTKSDISFSPNTPNSFQKMICKASKFKKVANFGKYLGSYIDGAPRSRKIFYHIMETLQQKLAGWKTKLISQASRVILIKSVLSSLPVYHLSYFALTEAEAKKCDSIVANFFWGHQDNSNPPHMIAWDKICQPKKLGGLGIRKFKAFNNTLLGRQAWRIIHNPKALLSQIYRSKYCTDTKNLTFRANSQATPFARQICKQIEVVLKKCFWRVGNGQNIQLGSQLWYKPIDDSHNETYVADLITDSRRWNSNMVSTLFDENTARQIMRIPISHTNQPDSIIWTRDPKGIYSVKNAYNSTLTTAELGRPTPQRHWDKIWKIKLPPKLSLFAWKCLHNGLPLGANLLKKQFKIEGLCPFGCDHEEDDTHLFLTCPMSRAAWFGSPMAYRSTSNPSTNFKVWLSQNLQDINDDNESILTQMLWFCWAIYSHRNEVLFRSKEPKPEAILNLWSYQTGKEHFFLHAGTDLPCKNAHATKIINKSQIGSNWSSDEILIAGQRFKASRKNIFAAFCFRSNKPHMLYYFCEINTGKIQDTFLRGLKSLLELSGELQQVPTNIVCQSNFNLQAKAVDSVIIQEDIHHLLADPNNKWKIANSRHDLKLKDLWPWIDSYIVGSYCFM